MSRPPLAPDELVASGTEREVLEAFLDLYREIVPRKLAGLGDDEARRSLVASSTTLLGLVQHLACVEREWFGQVLGGRPPATASEGAPAGDGWDVGPELLGMRR